MREISIRLPFFPGFYETIYETSDTGYFAVKEFCDYLRNDCGQTDVNEDDYEFNCHAYENDIVEAFAKIFKEFTPSFVEDVKDVFLQRPTYYNYENDAIVATLVLSDEWEDAIKTYLKEDREDIDEWVGIHFTSRDGFMSYLPNEIDVFANVVFDTNCCYSDVALGALIGHYMEELYERDNPRGEKLEYVIREQVMFDYDIYEESYVEHV